jgi:lipoprotein signal peptidase
MGHITNWFRRAWMVLAVAGIVIILDQLTKEWVRTNIPKYSSLIPIPALGEYFVFEHVDNYGAAFGILQNQGLLFVAIAVVVAIAILVYVRYLPIEQRLVRLLATARRRPWQPDRPDQSGVCHRLYQDGSTRRLLLAQLQYC